MREGSEIMANSIESVNLATTAGAKKSMSVTNLQFQTFSNFSEFVTASGYVTGLIDLSEFLPIGDQDPFVTTRLFTLTNGYYCECEHGINPGWGKWLCVYFYRPDGTKLNRLSFENAGSLTYDNYKCWFYTDGTNYGRCEIESRVNNDSVTVRSLQSPWSEVTAQYNEFINGSIAPEYTWEPVSHLAGNDNQFYMALSQIDVSIIGDGITNATSDDSSKFIINEISNISRLLANIPNNVETVLAYSGDNYMTVTRRWSEGIAPYNNIFFTFKLYSNDDQLLYTTPEIGVSDPPVPRKYLSFIKDDENEVAMFDIIRFNQNTGVYSFNNMPLPVPTDAEMNNIWTWLQGSNAEPETDDPYATGSTDDGGDPGNPRPQDHITDTPAPTLSGTNLGIVTLYQPDDTELLKISEFLWSDDVLDNFKKYFNNFADNILALYILPFTPANLPTKIFKVGKLASEDASLQAVSYCTQRYYDIDMGSVDIGQRWGSYLDYAPYTKIEVYLPYCGIHSLDIDELMSPAKMNGTLPGEQGCTLSLKYRMDILTGVIVAKLLVNGEVRYQFNGKAGSNIPLTGQTYSNWLGSIVTAGSAAAITIATGGMTAPLVAGSAASVAGTVLAQKPNVESIGNISGDASMLATSIPYVRISSPNKPLLENQEVFTGYPSYKSGTVGSFSGYTEFVDAHVEGISCTEEERSEIISLLKAGVII